MQESKNIARNWTTDLQHLVDGFLVTSKSNQILYANHAFSRYFDRTPKEITGRDLITLLDNSIINASKSWQNLVKRSLSNQSGADHHLTIGSIDGPQQFNISITHYEPNLDKGYAISIWRKVGTGQVQGDLQLDYRDLQEQINSNIEHFPADADLETIYGNYLNFLPLVNKISKTIHASLSVEKVVGVTLEEFKKALAVDVVFILLREGTDLEVGGYLSDSVPADAIKAHKTGKCLCGMAAQTNKVILSDNVSTDSRCTLKDCKKAGIQSLISIPLEGQDGNLGVVSLASLKPRDFRKEMIFLEAIVPQVSIALSNAKLYEKARRKIADGLKATGELSNYQHQLEEIVRVRTEELRKQYREIEREVAERENAETAEREQRTLAEALAKTSSILNSTLDLDEVLDSILVTLEDVIPHDSANIMLIDEEAYTATVARYKRNPKMSSAEVPPTSNFPIFETPTLYTMHHTKKPFVIPDVRKDSSWIEQIGSDWIRSYVAAPILFGEEVLGYLNLVSDAPNFYSKKHAENLQAFANHASIAIRNARLYDQAGDVAVLEERQRLARDMHDAVSQTLFTANMVAEALPLQWERDPQKGKEGLTKIRRLIRGALAEMRTLLYELRPDSLATSDLGELISQVAYGATSYSEMALTMHISGKHSLPEDVQVAFFRITQEIFNNIVKHARASHVTVDFENKGDELFLKVQDNGRGFDAKEIKTGRFGLLIMKERTSFINADLEIKSREGKGTTVEVRWKKSEEGNDG